MFLILIFAISTICKTNSVKLNFNPRFFKNKSIYTELTNLVKSKYKNPIILDGDVSPFKKDFCELICNINEIKFREYTFTEFIEKLPYLIYNDSVLYVNDFLVKNGRILTYYEENKLLELRKDSNLIIFQSDNINNIPIKDNNIVRHFPIIKFPKLNKRDIVQFIYDKIEENKYNDGLIWINWINYDIDKLNFEKINILLYEINRIFVNNFDYDIVEIFLKNMINSLINLDEIKY